MKWKYLISELIWATVIKGKKEKWPGKLFYIDERKGGTLPIPCLKGKITLMEESMLLTLPIRGGRREKEKVYAGGRGKSAKKG